VLVAVTGGEQPGPGHGRERLGAGGGAAGRGVRRQGCGQAGVGRPVSLTAATLVRRSAAVAASRTTARSIARSARAPSAAPLSWKAKVTTPPRAVVV
jgi:hypothetical protein